MQKLGLGLSLPTIKQTSGSTWVPSDEPSLLAWWKNATGVSADAAPPNGVARWNDQSGNNYHFAQGVVAEMPSYSGDTGVNKGTLTFDPLNSQNLEIPQITFNVGSAFTIGMYIEVATIGGVLFADNSSPGEFMRITSNTELRLKLNNGSAQNMTLDSDIFPNIKVLIVTRESSGLIEMWVDGVKQTTTKNDTDSFLIDVFGLRRTNLNPYDGKLKEAQIYTDTSSDLTTNVYNSLKDL